MNEQKNNKASGSFGGGRSSGIRPMGIRRPMGGRGPMGMMPGEKAKDFKGAILRLIGCLGRYKPAIAAALILSVASTVFTIIGPIILGGATDEIFNGVMRSVEGVGGINFTKVGRIIVFLAGLYGTSAILSYLQGYIMTGISMKVTYQLRKDIDEKIHRLPFRFFDGTTHGDILSRITNDIDIISQTLGQSLIQIITSVTSLIGIAVMMLFISFRLTLVTLLILPLSTLFVTLIVKKSQKYFANQQKYLGDVNGHIEEMFGNHTVVKAFNGEEDSLRVFDEYNDALYNSSWKANFLSGLMMPVTNFIGNITYVAVCILGGYFTVNGSMTVGGIQAFIQYVRSFTQPISQIANISNILQQTAASSERVFELLDEDEKDHESAAHAEVRSKDIKSDISFENVSFGYDPGKVVIHNFSANAKEGQKIAIVGPTGAGKTTLVKLLMRFYDVNGGCIKVGGKDIREFQRDELRSLFGMVLQDTWLFHGTIADNIRYGRLDASMKDVVQAAAVAQADHFIRTLPGGYDMVINEEADNISEGQKQLLTIARVILADPLILILDEATSSVDTRTETMIQKAMDNLMTGRTGFVIAHRLSTIRNADLILVVDEGDIVEQGTHNELIARGGLYENLYNSQFEQD